MYSQNQRFTKEPGSIISKQYKQKSSDESPDTNNFDPFFANNVCGKLLWILLINPFVNS